MVGECKLAKACSDSDSFDELIDRQARDLTGNYEV